MKLPRPRGFCRPLRAAAALLFASLPAALLAQIPEPASTYREIAIDGSFSDWAGVAPAASFSSIGGGTGSARLDLKDVYVVNDHEYIYVRFRLYQPLDAFWAMNCFLDGLPSQTSGAFYEEGVAWKARLNGNTGHQMTEGGWSDGALSGFDFQMNSGPVDDYEFRISRRSIFASALLPDTSPNPHHLEPVLQENRFLLRLRGNTVDGVSSSTGPIAYALTPTFREIAIDGDLDDWAGIPPLALLPSIGGGTGGARVDFKAVYVANDYDHLYVRFRLHQPLDALWAVHLFLDGQTGDSGGFWQEGIAWKARVNGNTGNQMTAGNWSEGGLADLAAAMSAGPADDYEVRISRHATFAASMRDATQANPHYAQPVFQSPDLHLRLRGNPVDDVYDSSGVISYTFSGHDPAAPGLRTVFPAYDPALLANPFKGIGSFAAFNPTTPAIPYSLAFSTITWKQLQPSSSTAYDWSALETGWAPHLAAGRRIGFRFHLALPVASKTTSDIPDWLATLGVPLNSYNILGDTGLAPDWNDSDLLDHHDAVIAALGARYDGDPRIAWIDLGSYGFWGEWHLYENTTTLPQATEATKRRIIDAYVAAFPNTPLVKPHGDPYASAYAVQPSRGVGLRNDCLGYTASDDWYHANVEAMTFNEANTSEEDLAVTVPLRAPISGEFCGAEPGANDGIDNRFAAILAFVEQTRWSFLSGAGGELVTSTGERLLRTGILHRRMGYRFRVDSATYPTRWVRDTNVSLDLAWVNEGIAPFYRAWPVRVALLNPSTLAVVRSWDLGSVTDIRDWTPGTHPVASTHDVTASTTPAGNYTLAVAIIDPDTDEPGIRLANTGTLANGFLPLGAVEVVTP